MKLSRLIHFRNILQDHRCKHTDTLIKKELGPNLYNAESHEIQFPALIQQLKQDADAVSQAFDKFDSTVQQIIDQVVTIIDSIEPGYFAESYSLYENDFARDTVDYILNRRIALNSDAENFLTGRIKMHGHWQHSGMIIRPGIEPWIHHLVGCDPLYLIDTNIDLISPKLRDFSEQYQHRLRCYVVKESMDSPIMAQIPDNQFAYCLIYNFFNYKPFEVIKRYLAEVYSKLKPGGTLAFTFNNCDLEGGVRLVENRYMCYTPASLIYALCESLGFEHDTSYQVDAACCWVEMKKPGKLSSLRGGQSLAKIVAKSK